jgi:hypothetical protein
LPPGWDGSRSRGQRGRGAEEKGGKRERGKETAEKVQKTGGWGNMITIYSGFLMCRLPGIDIPVTLHQIE